VIGSRSYCRSGDACSNGGGGDDDGSGSGSVSSSSLTSV